MTTLGGRAVVGAALVTSLLMPTAGAVAATSANGTTTTGHQAPSIDASGTAYAGVPARASTTTHRLARASYDDMRWRPGTPRSTGRIPTPARHLDILAARVYVGSVPTKTLTNTQTHQVLDGTAAWFRQVSRGRQTVSHDLTRWIKLPMTKYRMCSGEFAMLGAAKKAIARAGYTVAGHERLMLLMPQCRSNSSGEIAGPATWIREPKPTLAVMVHELGHNLGLQHAHAALCKKDGHPVVFPGHCYTEEYGDLWDAMGISDRSYSVGILKRLGWAGRTTRIDGSGTFTLRDAEDSGRGLQAVQVVVGGGRSYWLEYRREIVSDSSTPKFEHGTPGLQVRKDDGGTSLTLLDQMPGSTDPWLWIPPPDLVDVAMQAGDSWTSPEHVRIAVTKQTDSSLTVRVTKGFHARPASAPKITSALSHLDGLAVSFTPPTDDGGNTVLGYLLTSYPSGATRYVPDLRSATTTLHPGKGQAFVLQAVTQAGPGAKSAKVAVQSAAPRVKVLDPAAGATVPDNPLVVHLEARPNAVTGKALTSVQACLYAVDDYCYYDSWVDATGTGPAYAVTLYRDLPGDYRLIVRVEDKAGEVRFVRQKVVVPALPPGLSVTSPTEGSTVSQNLHVLATVTPNPTSGVDVHGVDMDLRQDGQSVDGYYVFGDSVDEWLTGLADGDYTLVLTANDDNGESTVVKRHITVAQQTPVLAITSPADSSVVDRPQVPVTYTIDDPSLLAPYGSEVHLLLDGVDYGYVPADQTEQTYDLYLGNQEGPHTLQLSVHDDVLGDWTTDPVSFTQTLVRPTVDITNPTPSTVVTTSDMPVDFTVDDPTRLTDGVSAYALVDGVYAGTIYLQSTSQQQSGTVSVGTPGDGPHGLELWIVDPVLGEWSADSTTFTFQNGFGT